MDCWNELSDNGSYMTICCRFSAEETQNTLNSLSTNSTLRKETIEFCNNKPQTYKHSFENIKFLRAWINTITYIR